MPSSSIPTPERSTAEMCTNTSFPPSSGVMKPKPLAWLKNLTVPVWRMGYSLLFPNEKTWPDRPCFDFCRQDRYRGGGHAYLRPLSRYFLQRVVPRGPIVCPVVPDYARILPFRKVLRTSF